MGRIRTIKPDFWQDEDMVTCSSDAQLMAIGLLNHADDEGYFKANHALVRAAIFPLREDSLNIHGMLTELSNIDYLELFEGSDGKKYGRVRNFTKHQKVNRPSPSKIKDLRLFTESSLNPHGGLTGGKEGKGREIPPDESDGFVFKGETIRINQADFARLQAEYPNIDLNYQLGQLDLELRGKKNWWVEMNSKLNYRNKTPAHQKSQGTNAGELV